MGANGNSNGKPQPVVTHRIISYSAVDLREIVHLITEEHLNGTLEISFSEGRPAGTLKWREKVSVDKSNSTNLP